MSENVGLTTPRGSGTSGYVQRNLSHLKPRQHPYARGPSGLSSSKSAYDDDAHYKQRQPDAEILDHERKRGIEVQVFALRDQLEEEGKLDEDEIDERCDALRRKLSTPVPTGPAADRERRGREDGAGAGKGRDARGLKSHQVHELAAAKIEETEKLRRALGIKEDYEEGGHWKRQEERRREGMARSGGGVKEEDEDDAARGRR